MWGIEVIGVALLVIFCTNWMIRKWRQPKYKNNGVFPPGSMGLPFIGETLQLFFVRSYSLDLHPFIKQRIQRYGSIFKTNLAGRGVVISVDPEFNTYIIKEEGNSVEMHYMDTYSKIFDQEGENKTNAVGKVHKYLRSLPLVYLGHEKLKDGLIPDIENLVNETLQMWSRQSSVHVKLASSIVLCDFIAKKLLSYDANNSSMKISDKFASIGDALLSFPLNVPGTAYHKCLKNKAEVLNMLKDMIKERRNSLETHRGDFLDQALADINTEKFLTENFIIQLVFGILFAGSDSNSAAITFLFKFLSEHPSVWQELTAEHEAVLRKRENPNSSITWDEYKSMTFTHQVINETLRLANGGPGLFRRALKDIQFKGYTIPSGWTIIVVTPAYHLNSTIYKDPLQFNPWRWKDLEPHVMSKNFMPFGCGTRQCAGAEFSRALLATFLHVLATKYRWTKIKGGTSVQNPFLSFTDGLQIKFSVKLN